MIVILSKSYGHNCYSLHKNPVVVVLVSVVVAVYTMLLVVAWRADRHDARKGHLVCLADNNVTDTQLYEVIIHTGLRQSGPTTAKVGGATLLVNMCDKKDFTIILDHHFILI